MVVVTWWLQRVKAPRTRHSPCPAQAQARVLAMAMAPKPCRHDPLRQKPRCQRTQQDQPRCQRTQQDQRCPTPRRPASSANNNYTSKANGRPNPNPNPNPTQLL